jgi:hypothetical protein
MPAQRLLAINDRASIAAYRVRVTSATEGAAPNSAGERLGFRTFTARANTQTTALPDAIMLITGERLIRTGEFRVAGYCGLAALTKYCKHEAFARFFKNMRRPADTV